MLIEATWCWLCTQSLNLMILQTDSYICRCHNWDKHGAPTIYTETTLKALKPRMTVVIQTLYSLHNRWCYSSSTVATSHRVILNTGYILKMSPLLRLYSGTPLKQTPLGPPLYVRNMEISVFQGVPVYYRWAWYCVLGGWWRQQLQGRIFGLFRCRTTLRKVNTTSDNIMPRFWTHRRWCTILRKR